MIEMLANHPRNNYEYKPSTTNDMSDHDSFSSADTIVENTPRKNVNTLADKKDLQKSSYSDMMERSRKDKGRNVLVDTGSEEKYDINESDDFGPELNIKVDLYIRQRHQSIFRDAREDNIKNLQDHLTKDYFFL
ncbi:hypothetical protein JTB14_032516 [Gonioctena quinquepunctata]|nr:hypothetical protein JTB14_032516 [Gonioctena quinquepunctata]